MNPILASSLSTKKFLDPENYTAPLHGKWLIVSEDVLKKWLWSRLTNIKYNIEKHLCMLNICIYYVTFISIFTGYYKEIKHRV